MIEHIRIENFKSIRSLKLDLRPLNILIGANGAGKSNFISFFRLVNRIGNGRLQEYAGRYRATSILHNGLKGADYLEGFLDFEHTNAYHFQLIPIVRGDDESLLFNKEGNLFNGSKQPDAPYKNWHEKESLYNGGSHRESYLQKQTDSRSKYVKEYLNSFKVYHFHDTSEGAPIRLACDLDDNVSLQENGSNLAAFLYYLKEKEPVALRWIEGTVRSIAPFFGRFELEPRRLNEAEVSLRWQERGSGAEFNATHLSDGTLRFIALSALLLQPKLPKTLIVDEPELGLHPAAIEKLAGLLRKAVARGCQIILSTQSVALVNEFSPEDIITVDRVEGQSVFNRWNENQLHDWLDDYSLGELWDKNVIGGRP